MRSICFALFFLLTACGPTATPSFLNPSQTNTSFQKDSVEFWKLSSESQNYGLMYLKARDQHSFELIHFARNLSFPGKQTTTTCLPPCMPGGLPADSVLHETPVTEIMAKGELELSEHELAIHYREATATKKYSTGVSYPTGATEAFSWRVNMRYEIQANGETMRLSVSSSDHPGFKVGDRLELKLATTDLY